MKEREAEKKDIINNLFILNLKYVNNYSEFIADSLSLSWSNFINNKKDSINKLNKNIDKISKIEIRKNINTLDKVILVDNLLLINKYIKEKKRKYLKNIMYEIQQINSFSNLLKYYVELYVQSTMKKEKKDELQDIVNTIKKKKNEVITKEKEIVYGVDNKGYYYTHILFDNNKMILNSDSFNEEKKLYDKSLYEDKKELLDKKYKFSSFEKKRIIYVNSMFQLDSCLCSLIDKKVDITYPVDKIFKCAKEIVDIIYKELIEIPLKESVLHNLMVKSVEAYGSKRKIELYSKIIDSLNNTLSSSSKFVYDEIVNSSRELISDYGYNEFKNIKGIFPVVDDLYYIVNNNIRQYVVKNVSSIISNLSCLDCYTKYMDIDKIVDIYNIMKQEMIGLRVSTSKYVLLQSKVVSLLVDRFSIDEDVVYTEYLNECRMN